MCEMWNVWIFHHVGTHNFFIYFFYFQFFLCVSVFFFFMLLVDCCRSVKVTRLTSPLLWWFQSVFTYRITTFSTAGSKRKVLAAPIICSLFLTIKAWRNKYPNRRVVVHSVFSSNQQVPSSHKPPPPPTHPSHSLPQRRKRFIVIIQRGRKIFLHSWAIYFSKCRSELLLNYSWKVVMAPSCMGQCK